MLHNENVPAAFFVIGENAKRSPGLLAREVDEGHLLGSHTYLHSSLRAISGNQLKLELNLTQRLIESAGGRQTLLFRPPYDADSLPLTTRQLAPLESVCQMGYVVAGADIDSHDWEKQDADWIVGNVLAGVHANNANVILFHDAGGDRSQTVKAVARLIPQLRKEGYEFVALNDLANLPAEAFNPTPPPVERLLAGSDHVLLSLPTWQTLQWVFGITTAIAGFRIIFLGVQLLRPMRRSVDPDFTPPVRVIVPAYNEAGVIRRTLDALLESDYPDLYVSVVDDGSTDDTAKVVLEMAAIDPRITYIHQRNRGKSVALNRGFREAREYYLVTIDADTIVHPQTVRRLIEPFIDDTVDAVCGNVQVGNVNNVLTAFQNVEYVTSQNYDRRAFDALNCISVVPGATGAWKRDTVLGVGGYSLDTLTEDADLTLSILRDGGRVVYAPLATSITEAPQCPGTLFKQRFRWSFGTFQCLWKHRAAFGAGTLGLVALPNMFIFQILFPILSPIGDVILLLCLLRGNLSPIASGYLIFLTMDLIGSFVAFRLDRRSLRDLPVVLIQRFYYRQFMYLVTFAALLAAVRGRRHGWNKLARMGTVRLTPETASAG